MYELVTEREFGAARKRIASDISRRCEKDVACSMQLCPIRQDGSIDLGAAELHPALPDVIAATVALYKRKGFIPPWTGYVACEFGCVAQTEPND